MKKYLSLLACLVTAALPVAAHAQESRQDASISYSALFQPEVFGNGVRQTGTVATLGILGSYRYLLTPRGAVEANYGFNRYITKYNANLGINVRAHTQFQEFSAEYVYSVFSYHNFFPFIEGGVGGYFFGGLNDNKSNQYPLKGVTAIGVPYGGGVAYEVNPSFDIRVAYRGVVVKAPALYGTGNITNTGRYENFFNPVVGVAYHF